MQYETLLVEILVHQTKNVAHLRRHVNTIVQCFGKGDAARGT